MFTIPKENEDEIKEISLEIEELLEGFHKDLKRAYKMKKTARRARKTTMQLQDKFKTFRRVTIKAGLI